MNGSKIGFAFAMTIIAGLSTSIGSLIAFLTKKPNKKFLAFSLGLSAGVMIYISLVEMLGESIEFLSSSYGNKIGMLYSVLAFFGGILITLIIDKFVPESVNPHHLEKEAKDVEDMIKEEAPLNINGMPQPIPSSIDSTELSVESKMQIECEDEWMGQGQGQGRRRQGQGRGQGRRRNAFREQFLNEECIEFEDCEKSKIQKGALLRSGLLTAIAIAIHNFPEGMATFISGLQGFEVAIPIVVAISLHNIPEGIAVSVPVYYATGSKKKAFLYSSLSGLAEPLGALVAYLIFSSFFSETLLFVLTSFVAGIMVFIALDELLPSAIRTGEAHLPIYGVVIGMALMAVTLIAFA